MSSDRMMRQKKQAVNPYLPSYEYIPDGEPYIFNDRIYVYGSHDRYNAPIFCMNDYVCWSAPIFDLSDWRYEGVIYRKNQDPLNRLGLHLLFAPDVAIGPDGRYYLYYALDFLGIMSVAVSDSPTGPYVFYGHVHYSDGVLWGRKSGDAMPFDPGILVDDDNNVYLYSGFAIDVPAIATGGKKLTNDGGVVLELEQDMVTIKTSPKLIFPKKGPGAFLDHAFFEASSIRKIKDKYYFVYSSEHNHELCYAVSSSPTGGFTYGGTLVSLGDLYLKENQLEQKGTNYLGNTHGGIVCVNDKWYVFYHRHTNRHSYSRQACAERLVMMDDGSFQQSELTSCGLNDGWLEGTGRYEARIACNLWSKSGVGRYDEKHSRRKYRNHPYFKQDGSDRNQQSSQYIANMKDGATAGFKYFEIGHLKSLTVCIRGKARGTLQISTDPCFQQISATIPIHITEKKKWCSVEGKCEMSYGKQAIYFRYCGSGTIDFASFQLEDK